MKIAIILGGAENVLDDFAQAELILENAKRDIFLVNDMIACFPQAAKFAVTMHPRKLNGWLNQRNYRNFPPVEQSWINSVDHNVVARTTFCWGPPSGLFATKIAVSDLRYDKVILCGIPMDAKSNHFLRKKPWAMCNAHRPAWEAVRKMGKLKNVRSMSGWTKDLLGFPDHQWINE